MEKFLENLQEAEKLIRTTDHLVYVALPMTGEKRIFTTALEKLETSVKKCISSILQYEFLFKRIKLYKDSSMNMKTFETKCSKIYKLNEQELKSIKELLLISKLHKESHMEFKKNSKIVILTNHSPVAITEEKLREFVNLSKNLLTKIKGRITISR